MVSVLRKRILECCKKSSFIVYFNTCFRFGGKRGLLTGSPLPNRSFFLGGEVDECAEREFSDPDASRCATLVRMPKRLRCCEWSESRLSTPEALMTDSRRLRVHVCIVLAFGNSSHNPVSSHMYSICKTKTVSNISILS